MIAAGYMDNERLGQLVRKLASQMEDDQVGFWKFEFEDRLVFVITDESHNRMRVMTPVIEVGEVPDEQMLTLMAANFDRALDARYCVNGEFLWSAFIHPLQELSADQFVDALNQVVTLSKNFGSSYSSSNLIFNSE